MNRFLVAGIAGFAMLVSAGMTIQDCQAGHGRGCGGGGGLFSGLGAARCGGQEVVDSCAGRGERRGLFGHHRAKRAADCCGEPAPVCCEPAPVCCEPAPVCCEPAPVCCAPAPSCGGCMTAAPSYSTGMVISGCANCSTIMDSGVIMESSAPMAAPPAPAPTPDPAADAPST
jgi:hypothetical protein